MGWKNVKEYYRIDHLVHVDDRGICIGSPYISDIIVISNEGKLIKRYDERLNTKLIRCQSEMDNNPQLLAELVQSQDRFDRSITVYTYDGGQIIEKQCEIAGYPNVTHDGELMYENTFSTDKEFIVAAAKKSAAARIEILEDAIKDLEIGLIKRRQALDESKENLAKLESEFIITKYNNDN